MNLETIQVLEAITRKGEVWAKVPGYNYLVSNLGRVFGIEKSQIDYGEIAHNGYRRVPLYRHSKADKKRVSLLVAEAFLDGYDKSKRVHHLNKHRDDNRAVNLIICTEAQHRAIHKLYDTLGDEFIQNADLETLRTLCNYVIKLFVKIGGDAV